MRPQLKGSARETRPVRPAAPVGTISVLIVDDDEMVAEVLAACCDEPGINVVGVVHNSDDALMAAASVTPDVALVDNRLAGISGVELTRELLVVRPGLKVVIITADPSPDVQRAALDAGCAACVGKTMNIGDGLPEIIRRAYGAGRDPVPPHPRD